MSAPTKGQARPRDVMEGYALVAVSFLIWGLIGALVRWVTMPESALNVLRMVIGAALVGALFARRATFAEVRRRDVWPNLLLMGAFSASTILLFFVAMRLTDVAVGMFLLFTSPVYVALLAPRFMRQPVDRVVYPALAIAVAGMLVILLPGLLGVGGLSLLGVACGAATGFLYACYALVTKRLTGRARSTTIALAEMVIDAVLLLPLGAWQVFGTGYDITRNDVVAAVVLGVVCTALPYVLYVEGLRRVRVEHASIIGYLEPVSAPFYAYLLLGEAPAPTTVLGAVLITVAGVLVIVYGQRETPVGPDAGDAGS
ncbi:MAG TPA: DMT family transporter [Thermoleophilia bacterium]|nr:DMT family transporter [Thermoleophilia bacterium]HQG04308.1 DMT family transporter [Thermoleophilia bacterium]HQG54156.1 DMT family transporter [Thermoleophilia bacterium]HQJ97058.1 DMT family transporter [Thermoleophilia bacterium]